MAETDPRQEAAEQAADRLHASHYDADKGSAEIAPPPAGEGAAGRGPSPVPPEEFTGLKLTPPKRSAGGFPAVLNSLKFANQSMGPLRSLQTLARLNQKGGFDCPGCAWPEPDGERAHTEFCENGAKHVANEATLKRVGAPFFLQYSVSELADRSDYWLNQQGRLAGPMVLRQGGTHYQPIAWEDAFRLIADELNACATPDEAVFYTSGRTSNEAAFLYQLFVRQYGTNNLPDCSNMCHESSGTGLTEAIGVGKGTVSLEDFKRTQLIFVIGQNPGTNHPRMLTALQDAKRRGARLIHVNPLPEAGMTRFKHPQEPIGWLGKGTPLADLFLPVRINGDVALLKGISKAVLETEESHPGQVLDHDFVEEKTHDFEAFAEDLRATSWAELVEGSGISEAELRAAADLFIQSDRTIFCWAMGLTQHANAVDNIQEIVNLALLRGQVGKPGAGLCPVRGHSNVQGDRTMGIWERPREPFLNALQQEFGFEPPRSPGLDTVESIKAMQEGRVRVFFALGGNFLSATPDTEYTAEALRRCRLTVQVSTTLNRSHLITGEQALILPCLGRTEVDRQGGGLQFVSTENSMAVVQSSQGHLPPATPHLLSEPAIIAEVARATLGDRTTVDWEGLVADYDRIRDAIEHVIPGFEDYNRRVRQPGGFHLPNLAEDRVFVTATNRANFTVHPVPRYDLAPGQILMMTIRTHDQFNTTIYSLDDRYRGIHNERRVVLLNEADIRELGLHPGQVVDLVSHFKGQQRTAHRFVVVAYPIPRRCAATYYPETNVLVPIGHSAARSNTPASKSVVITIQPAGDTAPFDYDRVDRGVRG